jgi:type I restriction enzyme, S subunit
MSQNLKKLSEICSQVALGKLVTTRSGGTPSRANPEYWGDYLPWVTAKDLKFFYLEDSLEKISLKAFEKGVPLAKPNDVIILVRGMGLLKDVPVGLVKRKMSFGQDSKALSPQARLDGEYLAHFLVAARPYLMSMVTLAGHGTGRLETEKLLSLKIWVPELAVQKEIVRLLSTWNKAIALTENLIAAKYRLKQGLMQQLLTGKRRFPKFRGREWRLINLGHICEVRRGASPRPISDAKYFSATGRGWIRIADVTASEMYLKKTKQYLSDLGESKSVTVDPGDLIMSICATIGVPRILDMHACIHDGFVVIRPKSNDIYKPFLLYFLDYLAPQLVTQGQQGTQKNLNIQIVCKIFVPWIEYDEQKYLADFFCDIDNEINSLHKMLNLMFQQKHYLLQKLLTGELPIL